MSKCRLCDKGHAPVINGSSVEHWVVTGIRTARVTVKACKEPDVAIARGGLLNISPPISSGPEFECENCLGMPEHGCYCAAMGAIKPGGPRKE